MLTYSLEQILSPPPFSAILSLLLILGLDWLGVVVLKRFELLSLGGSKSLRLQAVMVGAMLFAAVLYPLALMNMTRWPVMRMFAISLALVGGVHLLVQLGGLFRAKAITRIVGWVQCAPFARGLIVVLLIGLFFLAMGPVTSADALDYHIGSAITLLNDGGMPVHPEWFSGRLSGNGEVLNALGLALGAEQFGALIQFFSLTGIVALIWPIKDNRSESHAWEGEAIILAAVSSPVLLFLVSAPKPLLWPVSMTTFAFVLVAHPSTEHIDRAALRKRYALVMGLCMTALNAKFNFLLGGGIVGCLALYAMFRHGDLKAGMVIAAIVGAVVVVPIAIWKAHTYHASIIDAVFSPMPGHWPGTDFWISISRHNPDYDSKFPFPVSILVPDAPGAFSTLLGIGWLLLLWLRPKSKREVGWPAILAILVSIILTCFLAPPSARMFMEPYYWGLYLCSVQLGSDGLGIPRSMKSLIIIQSMVVALACWFGVMTLFPGALKSSWREAIMAKAANGYQLMRWVDKQLPEHAVILNTHRSMALAPRSAVSYGWSSYISPFEPSATAYFREIKRHGVTHALITGGLTKDDPLASCLGDLVAGPYHYFTATRNPFNRGSSSSTAWLYEFDVSCLPCGKGD